MAKSGNGSSRKKDPEDTADTAMDTETAATPAGASQGRSTGRRSTARKKRRLEDEDATTEEGTNENNTNGPTPSKRTRLHSPDPVNAKAKDNGDNGDDNMEDAEHESESESEAEQENDEMPLAAAAASVDKESNADRKTRGASKGAAKPPLPNLRVPSHQTPGKFAREKRSTSINPSGEVRLPTRQLVFGSTPTAAASTAASASVSTSHAPASSQTETPQQQEGSSIAVANGSSNLEQTATDPPEPVPEPRGKREAFAKAWVWFLFFAALTLVFGLLSGPPLHTRIFSVSDTCLDVYKRQYYKKFPPPTREVVNQTRVEEIMQMKEERRRQKDEKKKLIKELNEVREKMTKDISSMTKQTVDMKTKVNVIEGRVENHRTPVLKAHERISRIDQLLRTKTSDDLHQTVKALPEIKKALGESDRSKVLDLSSLDLWEIPEMPKNCLPQDEVGKDNEAVGGDSKEDELAIAESSDDEAEVAFAVIDQDRLKGWSEDLQALIDSSTDDLIKDDEISDQIRKWVQSEIKSALEWDKALSNFTLIELAKRIVKSDERESKGVGSLQAEAIQSQIDERLEIEIADQTGRFDFASIRNGASVVREGPRATSRSLVQTLPYFNRVGAHLGLRFYGYGAEVALLPTDPSGGLGQCWSFLSEEAIREKQKSKSSQDFSRGSVATLTVRLARPVFVHSIVVEHPPKEISDRMDSAIRVFRVVGYEDKTGSKGSHELGRFEYKPGKCGRILVLTLNAYVWITSLTCGY